MDKVIEKLEALRKAKGLTQEQIASSLGMKQTAYSRMLNSTGDLKLSTFSKICEVLGVSMIDILTTNNIYAKDELEEGYCVKLDYEDDENLFIFLHSLEEAKEAMIEFAKSEASVYRFSDIWQMRAYAGAVERLLTKYEEGAYRGFYLVKIKK